MDSKQIRNIDILVTHPDVRLLPILTTWAPTSFGSYVDEVRCHKLGILSEPPVAVYERF